MNTPLFHNQEILALFEHLNNNGVKNLVVGGFATNYYGFKRVTGDIDLWLEDTRENRLALIKALDDLGIGNFPELMEVPFLAGYCEILLEHGIYADLMDAVLGFSKDDFQACYSKAEVLDINGVAIKFISFDDHLISKGSSSRGKDRIDYTELQKVLKKKDSQQ